MEQSLGILTIAFDLLLAAATLYLAFLAWNRARLGQVATAVAGVAFLGLTAGLVAWGVTAGHWPLTTRFEFALLFAWATLGTYLALEWMRHQRTFGAFVLPVAVGLASYALMALAPDAASSRPLSPVLRSIWLQIHVVSAAVGYGVGGVAAGLAALYLVRSRRPGARNLPPAKEIEAALDQAVLIGFPFLSLAILAGAIWAQTAWGRYWGWDPKEIWMLVTWVVYLTFLHGRSLRSWRGRPLAWLALLGFVCILVTYLGVDWLAEINQLGSLNVF
jgi:cytochrome c-type biogenesis protein CcsB